MGSEQVDYEVGQDTAHGTPPAAPTQKLPIKSDSLLYGLVLVENMSKIGRKTTGELIPTGAKPNGGIETLVTPDDAGFYFANCMGAEIAVEDVPSSVGGKRHTFVPVATGPGLRMPSFSLIRNSLFEIQRYLSLQVVSWNISLPPNDLLNLSLTTRGYDEVNNTKIDEYPAFLYSGALPVPAISPYKHCKAILKIDDVVFAKIDSFTLTCDNKLTDNGPGLDGDCRPRDNTVNDRLVSVDFTAELDAAAATMRETKYKVGSVVSIELTIVGPEYETGYNYKLIFDIPAAIFNTYDAVTPETGTMIITARAQAHETPGNEGMYIYHEDLLPTKYLP